MKVAWVYFILLYDLSIRVKVCIVKYRFKLLYSSCALYFIVIL